MIDAVSDLIDTILKIDSFGNNVSSGLSIAQAVLGSVLSSNNLLLAQQVAGENTKARMSILTELISAVSLQRLRFTERQHKGTSFSSLDFFPPLRSHHYHFLILSKTQTGDIAVCRCLARTAARVLDESKDFISSGALQLSLDGLFGEYE